MTAETPDTSPMTVREEIFPGHANSYGTAFGGKILSMMDLAAGLAASRYAHCDFVTASLDAMDFRAPVKQGEIAEVDAQVVYTSTHTCGVKATVYAINKTDWNRKQCCQGIFFMVALGPDGRKKKVPPFEPEGEGACADCDEARTIHQRMLERRKKN
jgi:acyl-CoA hydrolase